MEYRSTELDHPGSSSLNKVFELNWIEFCRVFSCNCGSGKWV